MWTARACVAAILLSGCSILFAPDRSDLRGGGGVSCDATYFENVILDPIAGVGPEMLAPLFPMALIEQEVCTQRCVDIPAGILDVLAIWRPTPLVRATELERILGTPARIYYKHEGASPPGSHKPNTAVAQAYYASREGVRRYVTETGAGQWGSALAFATGRFGLECKVYMVNASYHQKPYRRTMIETWGGTCVASPSTETRTGRAILEQDPSSPGSLGIAISEAIEKALEDESTKYSLGSVLNHVLMHQTVIGLEALDQVAITGDYPDVVVGCVGGGSNFSGLALPFVRDRINGRELRILAVEPTSCPTLTRGPYSYDFGDTGKMTPLLAMHTLGHDFIPAPIHAGGLRYHGMAPIVSHLVTEGLIEPMAVDQLESFEAGIIFARAEGYIPAPETCHAIAGVIREARRARDEGREISILMSWSGHGLMDLAAYDAFLAGRLESYDLPEHEIRRALAAIEGLPRPPPEPLTSLRRGWYDARGRTRA
jgi:tryptophan synthase beta chain